MTRSTSGLLRRASVWTRAHLDRLIAIGALVDALHDAKAVNAFGLERSDGLVDEAERGNGEGDALAFVEGALNDMRGHQGLAGAGRRQEHRAAMAGGQTGAQRCECAFLMGTELTQAHGDPCECFFSSANFFRCGSNSVDHALQVMVETVDVL